MKLLHGLVVAAIGLACASAPARAAEYPSRTVELVPAGAAGGGLDLVARALESALREEKLFTQGFAINNMGGAGGNLAKNYIHQKKGNPHFLYLESNRIYTNRIVGTTHLTYTDVTPVARLITEYLVWGVLADSPYKSAQDILGPVDAMKLRSSMTLFARAAPESRLFREVLDRYFGGVADEATDARLA